MRISLRRRVDAWVYLVPLALATAFYLPGMFFRFWLYDAGLYAAVSLRMARTGEWWTPMQANATYFNKPPLAFWIHALFVKVLGESDWVLRLPELLSALACVALIVSIAKRLQGPRVALVTGVMLAASSEYFWRISRFRLDFMHTALMLAGVRMCVEGFVRGRVSCFGGVSSGWGKRAKWWIVAGGVPVGLALLVKPMFGLVALVLAGVWMVLARRLDRRQLSRGSKGAVGMTAPVFLPVLAAIGVALAVAAPWHLSMWAIHGNAFAHRYFVHETTMRATGEMFGRDPWWKYLAYFLNGNDSDKAKVFEVEAMAYWPILLCAAMAVLWWAMGKRLSARRSTRGGLLAQVYTFGLFGMLCVFGDKKGWYLIPVIPGIAWVGAMWAVHVMPRWVMRVVWRASGVVAVAMLVAVPVFGWTFERSSARPLDTRAVREFILKHPEGEYWNASVWRYENAPIYIRTGVWPKLIEDPNTGERWEPAQGSYVVYDKERNPKPDPVDEVVVDSPRFVMVRRVGTGPLPREGTRQ